VPHRAAAHASHWCSQQQHARELLGGLRRWGLTMVVETLPPD
jgi:hypothetical protein